MNYLQQVNGLVANGVSLSSACREAGIHESLYFLLMKKEAMKKDQSPKFADTDIIHEWLSELNMPMG
jgi:hypothetical protein